MMCWPPAACFRPTFPLLISNRTPAYFGSEGNCFVVQEISHRYPTIPSHLVISRTGAPRLLRSRAHPTANCAHLEACQACQGVVGPVFSSASPSPPVACRLLGLAVRVIYRGLVSFFRHFDPLPSSPSSLFAGCCRVFSSSRQKSGFSRFYLDTRSFSSSTASIRHHRSIVTRSQPSQQLFFALPLPDPRFCFLGAILPTFASPARSPSFLHDKHQPAVRRARHLPARPPTAALALTSHHRSLVRHSTRPHDAHLFRRRS